MMAALEQMTVCLESKLYRSCVSACNSKNQAAKRYMGYLHEHVQMIGHPAVGVQPTDAMFERFRHNLIEQVAVGVAKEYGLPMIAAKSDVIEAARHVQA